MSGVTDGIIVGYDGSPGSAAALHWAAREAWARGTALTICLTWRSDDLALAGNPEASGQARQHAELAVNGRYPGDEDRHGEIIQVIGADGAPPYLARWRDGYESMFFFRPIRRSATAQDRAPDTRGRAILTHRSLVLTFQFS